VSKPRSGRAAAKSVLPSCSPLTEQGGWLRVRVQLRTRMDEGRNLEMSTC